MNPVRPRGFQTLLLCRVEDGEIGEKEVHKHAMKSIAFLMDNVRSFFLRFSILVPLPHTLQAQFLSNKLYP